jgi:hypothetical protein
MSTQTRFTQITTAEGCVGKTIRRVHQDDTYLGLIFDDDTYLFIVTYGNDEIEIDSQPGEGRMLDLGVLSREEFEAVKRRREAEDKARQEATDRRMYERLRAKFEGREGKKADDSGS